MLLGRRYGRLPHPTPHAQGLPRLPPGAGHRPRAPARDRPGRLPQLRLRADRHPGARIHRGAAGQGRRGGRQAAVPLHRQRRAGRGAALRPDRAVRALRRPASRPARHAVQALPPGAGVAGREHATGPLPRVPAVRLRHDRHDLERGRHRGGVGHRRPAGRPGLRALHRARQQPHGPQRPAGGAGPGRGLGAPAAGARQAGQGRRRGGRGGDGRAGRRDAGPGPPGAVPGAARGRQRRPARPARRGLRGQRHRGGGHRPAAPAGRRGGRERPPARALPDRPEHRPRPRLLHRHRLRDVSRRPAAGRRGLRRRSLRQPGQPVHQPGAARRRRVARPRPPARRHGGAGPAGHGRDDGAGAGHPVRRRRAGRLPGPGGAAAGRRGRRRGLSRRPQAGPAARLRGAEGLPPGDHRGLRRAGPGHVAAQGPGRRHPAGGGGRRRGRRGPRRSGGEQPPTGGDCPGRWGGPKALAAAVRPRRDRARRPRRGWIGRRHPGRPPPAGAPGRCCRRPRATGSSPWRR